MNGYLKGGVAVAGAGLLALVGVPGKDKGNINDYVTSRLNVAGQHEVLKEMPKGALERLAELNPFGVREAVAGGGDGIYGIIDKLDPKAMEKLNGQKKYDQVISQLEKPLKTLIEYGVVRLENEVDRNTRKTLSFAFNELGFAYKQKGEYDRALKVLNIAMKFNPKSRSPYDNIGFVYVKLGNYKKAHEFYKKAISLTDDKEYIKKATVWLRKLEKLIN